MAVVLRGATVTFKEVPNFDRLSAQKAQNIIYDELIPACESQRVKLSARGNHAAKEAPWNGITVEEYDSNKTAHTLFDVARIQRAFAFLPTIVCGTPEYKTGSFRMRDAIARYQNESITYGDTIAAMLLRGYSVRFGGPTEPMTLSCSFKVSVLLLPL